MCHADTVTVFGLNRDTNRDGKPCDPIPHGIPPVGSFDGSKLTTKEGMFSIAVVAGLKQSDAYPIVDNHRSASTKTINDRACCLMAKCKIRTRVRYSCDR
jgi:hypothetical protein